MSSASFFGCARKSASGITCGQRWKRSAPVTTTKGISWTVPRPVETGDYACVLVKFENGASGVFQCSQISAGHPEGWNDARRNNLYAFYTHILKGDRERPADYVTFQDGHYLMKRTEAVMESGREKRWVRVV